MTGPAPYSPPLTRPVQWFHSEVYYFGYISKRKQMTYDMFIFCWLIESKQIFVATFLAVSPYPLYPPSFLSLLCIKPLLKVTLHDFIWFLSQSSSLPCHLQGGTSCANLISLTFCRQPDFWISFTTCPPAMWKWLKYVLLISLETYVNMNPNECQRYVIKMCNSQPLTKCGINMLEKYILRIWSSIQPPHQ